MTSIHDLPTEIMQLIFTFHVWWNQGSPYALLPICKLWRDIAQSTCQVWNNILYIDPRSLQDDIYRRGEDEGGRDHGGKIRCTTPRQLSRAIERTGNAKFSLTFIYVSALFWDPVLIDPAEWKCVDQVAISARCRELDLLDVTRPSRFLELFHDMGSLEVLKVAGNALATDPIHPWLVDMEKGSPLLKECYIPFIVQDYARTHVSRLLRRCKIWGTFRFSSKAVTHPTLLPLVEELVIEVMDKEAVLEEVEAPNLRRLTIGHNHIFTFPPELCRQLTSLTLKMGHQPLSVNLYQMSLPSLKELEINCCWSILLRLEAPNLYELVINSNGHDLPKVPLRWGNDVRMLPTILKVDNSRSMETLIGLLEHIGQNVEVLYLADIFDESIIPEQLAKRRDVVEGERKELGLVSAWLLCPRLHTLIALSPEPRLGFDYAHLKTTAEKRLAQIVDARKGDQLLTRVRFGWYPRPIPQFNSFRKISEHFSGSRKQWWTIEWKDFE